MLKLEVFDPPMCCATGICGNSVDPKLVTFASDLEWLKKQGIEVVRRGLSFEPAEFVKNEAVKKVLNSEGNNCLPLIVIGEEIVSKGCYPSRETLAGLCQVDYEEEAQSCCCGTGCNCGSAAPEEEISVCGPDCDCHKSEVSNNSKKIIFLVVLLIIAGIVVFKLSSKAGAAETFYKNITSISQINSNEEVAFVYIPAKDNQKMSNQVKTSMLSAQSTLKAKNITAYLYTLSPKSLEYPQIASKTTPPAVLTIYKGKGKNYVSGTINQTRLLQSYMAATQEGACGAGCPCHKKSN